MSDKDFLMDEYKFWDKYCQKFDKFYYEKDNNKKAQIFRNLSSDLNIRRVNLGHDFIVDRDLNSAVNIAKKYGALWSVHSFNKYSLLNVKEINSNELE